MMVTGDNGFHGDDVRMMRCTNIMLVDDKSLDALNG